MKDLITKIVLSMIKKEQIAAFVFGALIAITSGLLGMTQGDLKRAVCSAPEVKLPITK